MESTVIRREKDFGKFEYGCDHYKRRCKIRAPCCDQIFPCRHCHNEAANSLSDPKERHELVRQGVKRVVCLVCDAEQEVSQVCSNCGINMGEYYCSICKLFDDDTSKGQFHCDECGICRVGGRDNFFHCDKCGACYAISLRNNHLCVENSMKNYCPVCYEYLFDSVKGTQVMKCGHTMHIGCFNEMLEQKQYRCPICSKSMLDMSLRWQMLDMEIGATEMPEKYRFEVSILCNDCDRTSSVMFHILGLKCQHCGSYNSRRVSSSCPEHQQSNDD